MAEPIPPWLRAAFGVSGRLAPGWAAQAAAELLTRPRGRNPPQAWEVDPSRLAAESLVLPSGLHALAWGGKEGPLVLAQHGWRGRPTQFGRIAAALVPAGYRLVALDAPGHGRSPGHRATPRLVADTLVSAARDLEGVHAIIGHSLGAAAAAIAVEFGLPARRLVMIGSPSRPSRMIAGYADRIGLPGPARAALDQWFDTHAGRPVADLDPISLPQRQDVATLVVHDCDDEIIPVAEAQLLQAAWPAARFLYTSGLGHRDLLADPMVVQAVAEFVLG